MHLHKITTRGHNRVNKGRNESQNCSIQYFFLSFLLFLTLDACPLMGNVVLQLGSEGRCSNSAPHTPIIYQQEGLVLVQAVVTLVRVLYVVLGRKTALKKKVCRLDYFIAAVKRYGKMLEQVQINSLIFRNRKTSHLLRDTCRTDCTA